MSAEIVPFEPDHWLTIEPRLCACNRERIAAIGPVEAVVARALSVSKLVRTGLIDSRPECLMGLGETFEIGFPWLMRTDLAADRFWALIRRSRDFITECLDVYPVLRVEVAADDVVLSRWLRWLGFRAIGPIGADIRWEKERSNGN